MTRHHENIRRDIDFILTRSIKPEFRNLAMAVVTVIRKSAKHIREIERRTPRNK